jgi:hypothetical protein
MQTLKCSLCFFIQSFFPRRNTKDNLLLPLDFVYCCLLVTKFSRNVSDIAHMLVTDLFYNFVGILLMQVAKIIIYQIYIVLFSYIK